MMLAIISFFFISPLHVEQRLLYIIKEDSSEGIQHRSFPVKFGKFLRATFFTDRLR